VAHRPGSGVKGPHLHRYLISYLIIQSRVFMDPPCSGISWGYLIEQRDFFQKDLSAASHLPAA
jgi:hypothetical protein